MRPWLVLSTPEQVLQVRALAGDIALCSWARYPTLTVPLPTPEYKWVQAIVGETNKLQEVACNELASRPEGGEILPATSCYGNGDKLWQL